MILNIQDDILKLHSLGLLDKLLADKTTGKRVMWATDAYSGLGPAARGSFHASVGVPEDVRLRR